MTKREPITIQQAREIAVEEALRDIGEYMPQGGNVPIFEDEYAENEDCWIFFRNRQIHVPVPNRTIVAHWAFSVSRFGDYLTVRDYHGNAEALTEQLSKLSAYYKAHDFP